jgi:hypothetical protein
VHHVYLTELRSARQQRIHAAQMNDVARESRRAAAIMAESAGRMLENARIAVIEARRQLGAAAAREVSRDAG